MRDPLRPAARPARRLVGGLTLLTLAGALAVGYHRPGAPQKDSRAREDPPGGGVRVPFLARSPVTIVPGVHLLGGLEPAAAYVVEASGGLALVDAGLDTGAGPLRRQMAALGLDWRRVRAILLTHAHGDHSGGAQYLRGATGAKIYAGRGDAAVLRAGGPREAFFSTFAMPAGTPLPPPTTVDVELSDDQDVALGDVRFRALATPGHTPGSVCYLMERAGRRVLFAGDVILSLGSDRPLGTYAAYLAPRYRGDAAAFLATLRRLRALPPPDLVLPGHPRNDPMPVSPEVSPGRWRVMLDAGIREMERLRARYARGGANFLDGVPKELLPRLYYLGDRKGAAVYGFFAGSKFFLVDAPGGPGLGDFISARLRRLGVGPVAPTAVLLTSGNREQTAGLAGLLGKGRPLVVASPAAWEAVRKACPAGTRVLAPEELPGKGWFSVDPIRLGGRGVGPVAYRLPWGKKSVLFSGRIPVKLTRATTRELLRDLSPGRGSLSAYRASLDRLGALKPGLWLPALPADGQNASLDDGEWEAVLAGNAQAVR